MDRLVWAALGLLAVAVLATVAEDDAPFPPPLPSDAPEDEQAWHAFLLSHRELAP